MPSRITSILNLSTINNQWMWARGRNGSFTPTRIDLNIIDADDGPGLEGGLLCLQLQVWSRSRGGSAPIVLSLPPAAFAAFADRLYRLAQALATGQPLPPDDLGGAERRRRARRSGDITSPLDTKPGQRVISTTPDEE